MFPWFSTEQKAEVYTLKGRAKDKQVPQGKTFSKRNLSRKSLSADPIHRRGRRNLQEELFLRVNDQADSTGSTSARSLIPEPVDFPPTQPGRERRTQNSSRGRQSVNPISASTIADQQGVHPDLPGYSGRARSSSDPPEEPPVSDQASTSNSQASQNTNPAPVPTVQNQPVPNQVPKPVQPVVVPQKPVAMSSIDHGKLPNSFGKNALVFSDSEDIESLPAYLENIESIAVKVGAKSAVDKKWIALHYCEARTKEHWKALATAKEPFTWEEFKAEVKSIYPELKEVELGSLPELQRIVTRAANKRLKMGDTAGLQHYHREFRATVQKLLAGTPRIVNREVVRYYLTGLSPALRSEVKLLMRAIPTELLGSYIREQSAYIRANPNGTYVAPIRDEADQYEWTDVMDAATRVMKEESLNVFGLDAFPTGELKKGSSVVLLQDSRSEQPSDVKALEAKIAKLEADTVRAAKKEAEEKAAYRKEISDQLGNAFATHLDKFTSDQHKELQQIKLAVEGSRADTSVRQSSSTGYSAPSFVRNRTPTGMSCFYCYEPGHFILECLHLKEDISKGRVKMDSNNRTRLYDGKSIPREPPHKAPRDKVREYFENRALVAQNYDEIMDQFFGTDEEVAPIPQIWERQPSSREAPASDTLNQVLAAIRNLERPYETRSTGPAESRPDF